MGDKLVNILNQYVDEYKNMKEIYNQNRTTQSLYKELIKTLKDYNEEDNKLFVTMLLSTIYKDNIYVDEFYSILLSGDNEKIIKFTEKIVSEYNQIKENNKKLKFRIDRSFDMFKSAKRVLACLKYQTKISDAKNDVFNVKRIINYYEISGLISKKEELLLINEIELHNRKVATKNNEEERNYTQSLYNEIPNILSMGFQEHDNIKVLSDRKVTLDKFSNEIINLINNIELENINGVLDSYKKYNLENNEFNYIIVKLLDEYLEELLILYELLMDKEVYINRKERVEIIKNYYFTLGKYLNILNYYNNQTDLVVEDEVVTEVEDNNLGETSQVNRLIYVCSDINVTKAKIISDMSYISYEYYEIIGKLLSKFKNGTLSKTEYRNLLKIGNYRGFSELRFDQVRIIVKHVKDNIFMIYGVFIKKEDNDMLMYRKMLNRMIPDIGNENKLEQYLQLSEIIEKEIEKIIKEKGRKTTR